jgi:SAM-dependent methyltransferase
VAGAGPTGWKAYDSVAEEYERLTPPLFGPIARDLAELLRPAPSDLVLDAGTGTGTAAEAVARHLDGDGVVVGVDPSPPMLALARDRLALRVAGVAPGLPFPDGTFDALVANLVLSHLGDVGAGVADLVRILRPGGRLGATAWPEDRDELDGDGKEAGKLVESALENAGLGIEPTEKAAGAEEWLKEAANLRAALSGAGLEDIVFEERSYRQVLTPADYLGWRLWGGRGRYLRAISDDETWDQFRRDALAALEGQFQDGIRSVSHARLAVGTKPGGTFKVAC